MDNGMNLHRLGKAKNLNGRALSQKRNGVSVVEEVVVADNLVALEHNRTRNGESFSALEKAVAGAAAQEGVLEMGVGTAAEEESRAAAAAGGKKERSWRRRWRK